MITLRSEQSGVLLEERAVVIEASGLAVGSHKVCSSPKTKPQTPAPSELLHGYMMRGYGERAE
jgi:hypothetical protein